MAKQKSVKFECKVCEVNPCRLTLKHNPVLPTHCPFFGITKKKKPDWEKIK